MVRSSGAIALMLVLLGVADAEAQFGRLQNMRNDASGSLSGSCSSSRVGSGSSSSGASNWFKRFDRRQ